MEGDANDLFFEEDVTAEQPPNIFRVDENQPAGSENNELQDIPLAVTKKKKNMKPMPKLDVRRLLGPRGLPCLEKEFDSVKFQGKGHEVEDLEVLMSHLEHWAHRLFPRMTFDDCLEKVERLGHKKEIQTCMKKLRIGMPLLDDGQETTVITDDGPLEDQNEGGMDGEIANIPMDEEFD